MKPEKIRITKEMIINDMGLERPSLFFEEFDKVGDPLYGVEGGLVRQTLYLQLSLTAFTR